MARRLICWVAIAALLAGCETATRQAPPITAPLIQAGKREHADAQKLAEGRALLLNRCIQCHALPETAKYDPPALRKVVATMSNRAGLTTEEHDAVLKYLLTVRSVSASP
jgi:mono/diheme cytochrome c family protein